MSEAGSEEKRRPSPKRRLWGGTDAPPGPRFRIDPIPGRGPVSPGGGKIRPWAQNPVAQTRRRGVIIEANRSNCCAASLWPVRSSGQPAAETKGEPSLNPSICYVVGAMPLSWSLCPHPGAQDFLIAADKGYEALEAYGVPPNLVVGDFDSLGRAQPPQRGAAPRGQGRHRYGLRPAGGLDRGYRRFVLLGGVGGRLEHTLANLQALAWLTTQGARGVLAGRAPWPPPSGTRP